MASTWRSPVRPSMATVPEGACGHDEAGRSSNESREGNEDRSDLKIGPALLRK